MPHREYTAEASAIAAEQVKAFYQETWIGNLLGAVVLSLIVWGNADYVPFWTWGPALAVVYVITAVRSYLFRQYRINPGARTPAAWGLVQTVSATLAGIGWGFANTAMCFHLPVENQLFVAAVAAVAASYAAAGGFAYVLPPWGFIVTSMVPLTAWFYTKSDRLHLTLAVMLTIYILSVFMQGSKRHRAFIESLQLRFKNEFLARELTLQMEIAEAAAQAKTRFLAAASHDLRQPVQAMTIFQELIRREMTLTPKGESYFATMQHAVKGVHDLLDALLDVSRLDADAIKVQREPFPVAELFDQLRIEFGPLASQKGIELRIARSSVLLDTDPMLLGQLLRNLVSNALRYTSSGKVLVGCRRRQDRLAIEVWDTGIGIHPDHQRAIFNEFFQVANRERDRQKGLGLGLAIADRVARLLGATITVKSTPGKGSCFSVALPLSSAPWPRMRRAPPDAGAAAAAAKLEGRLVVVVENEEVIRKGIHELLESLGCAVISGPSKESVLSRIEDTDGKVAAVISDFGLPGDQNGVGVIQELRQQFGHETPALLITGDTSPSVARLASRAGVEVLYKPVRPELLQQILASLIGR